MMRMFKHGSHTPLELEHLADQSPQHPMNSKLKLRYTTALKSFNVNSNIMFDT